MRVLRSRMLQVWRGLQTGMQADSDYSGSEDGQEEEPEAQVKVCEECGVEEVAGVLDKGQLQFRYAVRELEDVEWRGMSFYKS